MNGQERRTVLARAGVYFVCDVTGDLDPVPLCARVAEAGVRLVQLRMKGLRDAAMYAVASRVATELRRRGALLVLNDRVDIALAVDADGVHLGGDDLPVSVARRILGGERLVGASAHDASEAARAVESGADYLGCGSVFPTGTKDDAVLRGLDVVREVRAATVVPVFGIGGIDASNAGRVIQAGADGVAVASAIARAPDPAAAAKRLLDVVSRLREARDPAPGVRAPGREATRGARRTPSRPR